MIAPRNSPDTKKWRNFSPMPVDEFSARAISILPKSMWSRIEFTTSCWNWHGAKTSSGYGSIGHDGRIWSTHRLAYELLISPIPRGLQIDHLCRNRLCCDPRHLEPVTLQENRRRQGIPTAYSWGAPRVASPR